jgi:hypothetical protein
VNGEDSCGNVSETVLFVSVVQMLDVLYDSERMDQASRLELKERR